MTWSFYEADTNCAGTPMYDAPYALECEDTGTQPLYDDYDSTGDDVLMAPPPSVSTTPFPTMENAMQDTSELHYCAAATTLAKFSVSQVILA